MKNDYPVEQITPLDAPYSITVRKGERIIKHKGMYIFADRAYVESGVVYAPMAGGMNYRAGVGYWGETVVNAIGSWASSAWGWITGAPAQPTGQPLVTSEYDYNGQRFYTFMTSSGEASMLASDYDAAYGNPFSGSGSNLSNPSLNLPDYNTPSTGASSAGGSFSWDNFWKGLWNAPVSYNTNSGLTVGANPPAPGSTAGTQPGATNVYAQLGEQALGVAEAAIPWVMGGLVLAIIVPSIIGAVTKRSA